MAPEAVGRQECYLHRRGANQALGPVRRRAGPPISPGRDGRYSQMYSSAIAPSRHFATVTIRPPPSHSPTTQVHSPDPKPIGWDVTWRGVPPLDSTNAFM